MEIREQCTSADFFFYGSLLIAIIIIVTTIVFDQQCTSQKHFPSAFFLSPGISLLKAFLKKRFLIVFSLVTNTIFTK